MAKKKPGTPSKTCVDPNCGTTMHARQLVCPKCGKEQASKKKPKTKARPATPKPRQTAPGGLPEAVSFVRQVGGLNQAKQLLSQIDEIKRL